MRLISGISIAARLCSTALIFLLVHSPADVLIAIACQSGGVLLQGFVALGFTVFVLKIRFQLPRFHLMWH